MIMINFILTCKDNECYSRKVIDKLCLNFEMLFKVDVKCHSYLLFSLGDYKILRNMTVWLNLKIDFRVAKPKPTFCFNYAKCKGNSDHHTEN